MIGEIGEVIDIVKKHGGIKVSTDEELRKDLVEEMANVLMYYNDVMLCYGITADELKQAYSESLRRIWNAGKFSFIKQTHRKK